MGGIEPGQFDREQVESQRLTLSELTADQMDAILDGDAAAAAPPSAEYPPAGSLVGLRIRREDAARGHPAGGWV